MFYWVAKKRKFPADKWRFDKTDPHYCYREQYTRSNAATARPLILVRPAEI